jgi:uncharacterized protein YggE
MKRIIVFTACLLAASPALALPVPPPPPAPVPMLTISGEAKETLAPDQAIITATLSSREQKLEVAKKNNDAQMERVLQITKEFGIPREKITPSNLNINPEYVYNNATNRQEMVGYIVSRTLRITMDKLTIHERVLSALVDAKIDQVSGVEFAVANPEPVADKLRLKAFENARAKAQALAATAGMKLGKPISISVSGSYAPPMLPMPMARMAMAADSAEKLSVAPSLPGMLELREEVNVVFALE